MITNTENFYLPDQPEVSSDFLHMFERSSSFMTRMYDFIDKLANDSGVSQNSGNLEEFKINIKDFTPRTTDADTTTYRGKLYFISILDLFHCLEMIHVNTSSLTPINYPLAKYALKVEGIDFSFETISIVESGYLAMIDMIKPIMPALPTVPHVFILAEILSDYEQDLSWYSEYLGLIGEFVNIIREFVDKDSIYGRSIENFLVRMNSEGINL